MPDSDSPLSLDRAEKLSSPPHAMPLLSTEAPQGTWQAMSRRLLWCSIALPIVAYVAHFAYMMLVQPRRPHFYLSESGPHEMGAGLLFLTAGVIAATMAWRHRRNLPRFAVALLGGYTFACIFVGLEELSYGQHLFGWESGAYFEDANVQKETNLHNLYSQRPQRLLSNIGEICIVVAGLILPAVMRFGKSPYAPGHWPRYILPRWELATVALLSVSLRLLKDRHPVILEHKATDEFMEFLWAMGAVFLILAVARRLRQEPARTAPGGSPQTAASTH